MGREQSSFSVVRSCFAHLLILCQYTGVSFAIMTRTEFRGKEKRLAGMAKPGVFGF
jgi:hypothetical protein